MIASRRYYSGALALAWCLCLTAQAVSDDTAEYARLRLLRHALRQAEKITSDFDPSQRDCAGFVRYLYRQSLTGVSRMWRDAQGTLTDYVRAEELVPFNFDAVGRMVMPEELRTGDLLVYYSPHKPAQDAWHLMVVLKPPASAPDKILVAYHNGESGRAGSVRKVWLDDLKATTATQWRPVASNPRFMGYYRWKGWSTFDAPKEKK